jgi:carbonic anhydrase
MIEDLLAANKVWSDAKQKKDPNFFLRLAAQQSPEYLWIGCSDSRVPANDIVGRDPGEMFVHRNVANLCTPSDLNFLSVVQYAVEVLKVRRILVVGHYGCGGVLASLGEPKNGLVDHWLGPVRALAVEHKAELEAIADPHGRHDRLVELNVLRQVELLNANPIIVNARQGGHAIGVHGWVYSLKNGLVTDLHAPVPAGALDPGPSPRKVAMETVSASAATPIATPILSTKKGLFGRSK